MSIYAELAGLKDLWVKQRMVLEGLKRAEQLVSLLKNAGFKHPDAKVIKAEHFDSEFEMRQFASVLSALLDGLARRVLSSHEVARYAYSWQGLIGQARVFGWNGTFRWSRRRSDC